MAQIKQGCAGGRGVDLRAVDRVWGGPLLWSALWLPRYGDDDADLHHPRASGLVPRASRPALPRLPGPRRRAHRAHHRPLRRARARALRGGHVPRPVQRAPEGARGHRAALPRGLRRRHLHLPDQAAGAPEPPRRGPPAVAGHRAGDLRLRRPGRLGGGHPADLQADRRRGAAARRLRRRPHAPRAPRAPSRRAAAGPRDRRGRHHVGRLRHHEALLRRADRHPLAGALPPGR